MTRPTPSIALQPDRSLLTDPGIRSAAHRPREAVPDMVGRADSRLPARLTPEHSLSAVEAAAAPVEPVRTVPAR